MKKILIPLMLMLSLSGFSQVVNIGTGANTGDGDPLRDAFVKINTQFAKDLDSIAAHRTDLASQYSLIIANQGGSYVKGTPSQTQVAVWDDSDSLIGSEGLLHSSSVGLISTGGSASLTLRRPISTVGQGTSAYFQLYNSSSDYVDYASINSQIVGNTAGSETGALRFFTRDAGSLTQKMYISSAYATVEVPLMVIEYMGADSIVEYTVGHGVVIDGVLIKDSDIYFDYYGDPDTYIQHNSVDAISFISGNTQVMLMHPTQISSYNIYPLASNTYNLGSSSFYWKSAYVDTVYIEDTDTYILKDGSNNLVLTDDITGTKTLAELAAGTSYTAGSNISIANDSVSLASTVVLNEGDSLKFSNSADGYSVYVDSEFLMIDGPADREDGIISFNTEVGFEGHVDFSSDSVNMDLLNVRNPRLIPGPSAFSAEEGSMYYNDVANKILIRDNSEWDTVTTYKTKHSHTWMYFADSSVVIAVDQNTWVQVTNAGDSLWRVRDVYGSITISSDSVLVPNEDHYNVWAEISFTGTASDDYQVRLAYADAGEAVNELSKAYVSTDGTDPVTVNIYGYWQPAAGDRLWMEIRNVASGDDPTIIGGSMTVQWYHYAGE